MKTAKPEKHGTLGSLIDKIERIRFVRLMASKTYIAGQIVQINSVTMVLLDHPHNHKSPRVWCSRDLSDGYYGMSNWSEAESILRCMKALGLISDQDIRAHMDRVKQLEARKERDHDREVLTHLMKRGKVHPDSAIGIGIFRMLELDQIPAPNAKQPCDATRAPNLHPRTKLKRTILRTK